MEAAADDLPGVLGVMKQHLEAQNSGKHVLRNWLCAPSPADQADRTHAPLQLLSQSPSLDANAKSIVERLESLKEKDHTVSVTNECWVVCMMLSRGSTLTGTHTYMYIQQTQRGRAHSTRC